MKKICGHDIRSPPDGSVDWFVNHDEGQRPVQTDLHFIFYTTMVLVKSSGNKMYY